MVFIGRVPFAFCLKNTSYYMHIGKMKFHKQFNEKEWYFLVNNAGNELLFFPENQAERTSAVNGEIFLLFNHNTLHLCNV